MDSLFGGGSGSSNHLAATDDDAVMDEAIQEDID